MQLQSPCSSVSGNSSHQREAKRLSCQQRIDASRTSKSLSTLTSDTRSFPAPRTNAGSLPTFSGSLPNASSLPTRCIRETAQHSASMKKMKVEVDLTEDDSDFENDLDVEMMMMAQTTEQENSSSCSSSSRIVDDKWTGTQANSRCNVTTTDTVLMGSRNVSQAIDNTSCTALDSRINYSRTRCNISGSRQSSSADEGGFTNRDMMDLKHCLTDADIRNVKHRSVARNNSVGDVYDCSGNVATATYSASPGSV